MGKTPRVSRKRSQAVKAAWRRRKRQHAWKGICPVCQAPVWTRGLKRGNRWYHRRCWQARQYAKALGLRR